MPEQVRHDGIRAKFVLIALAFFVALLVSIPAFAQAAPAAPAAPGVGDAVDRALGQLAGGGASAPGSGGGSLSLSRCKSSSSWGC